MPDQNLEILRYKTYLRMIENAPGTRMFASLFARRKDNGSVMDVLNDGEYSCAVFVSSVLALSGLMDKPHVTVETVRVKLAEQGWSEVHDAPRPGDVVVWKDRTTADGSVHGHIGFAIGNDEVVSTSAKERQVARHHLTYGTQEDGTPKRSIVAIYRHSW